MTRRAVRASGFYGFAAATLLLACTASQPGEDGASEDAAPRADAVRGDQSAQSDALHNDAERGGGTDSLVDATHSMTDISIDSPPGDVTTGPQSSDVTTESSTDATTEPPSDVSMDTPGEVEADSFGQIDGDSSADADDPHDTPYETGNGEASFDAGDAADSDASFSDSSVCPPLPPDTTPDCAQYWQSWPDYRCVLIRSGQETKCGSGCFAGWGYCMLGYCRLPHKFACPLPFPLSECNDGICENGGSSCTPYPRVGGSSCRAGCGSCQAGVCVASDAGCDGG